MMRQFRRAGAVLFKIGFWGSLFTGAYKTSTMLIREWDPADAERYLMMGIGLVFLVAVFVWILRDIQRGEW